MDGPKGAPNGRGFAPPQDHNAAYRGQNQLFQMWHHQLEDRNTQMQRKSFKHHLEILEELCSKLEQAGLTLALSKCQFAIDSLEYLGYKVSSSGLTPMKKKVEALQKFPPPTKQKELLVFLGTLNYYRASLPQLRPENSVDKTMPERSPAAVLEPLYKLATCKIKKQKGNYFSDIWNKHPHLSDSFEDAKTDVSKASLGASLDQWINGQWRRLGLWSKTLKPSHQRYSTTTIFHY